MPSPPKLFRLALPALALLLVLAVPPAARAQKAGQVTSVLQAFRVVVDPKGAETFQEAKKASAGDVLEYRLTYENGTAGAVKSLQATLPIPSGTTYVEGSARPAAVQASLDGSTFAPVPLMRDEKQPDGKVRRVAVPVKEYRSLRWTVPTLEAAARTTLVARVRIQGPATPR